MSGLRPISRTPCFMQRMAFGAIETFVGILGPADELERALLPTAVASIGVMCRELIISENDLGTVFAKTASCRG